MIKINVQQMQGGACGLNCLQVQRERTIGFIIPIPYFLKGYWGGMCFIVFSFTALQKGNKCEIMVNTIQQVLDHLEITFEEFDNALEEANLHKKWTDINTIFYKFY